MGLQLLLTSVAGYFVGSQIKGYFQEQKGKIAPVVGILTLLLNIVWDLTQGTFGLQTFAVGGAAAIAPAGFQEVLKGTLLTFFRVK